MKHRHHFAIIVALTSLLSLSLFAPDAEAQRRRSVERHTDLSTLTGVVNDASTGEALAGADVTIRGTVRQTNSKGEYKFTNLAPGTWSVTASRWGYSASTREVTVGTGENTADFSLELAPFVTVTRTTGETERIASDTVRFGYVVPFTGTFASEDLKVCTDNPDEPITLERGSIARINGPAERVSTPCCSNFDGEQVTIQRKSGETFDAVILDSCPPYDIYFIGRSLDTGKSVHRRLSQVSLIEFPE